MRLLMCKKDKKIMCVSWIVAHPHPEIDSLHDNYTLRNRKHPTCDKRKQINETKSKARYVHMYKGDQMK